MPELLWNKQSHLWNFQCSLCAPLALYTNLLSLQQPMFQIDHNAPSFHCHKTYYRNSLWICLCPSVRACNVKITSQECEPAPWHRGMMCLQWGLMGQPACRGILEEFHLSVFFLCILIYWIYQFMHMFIEMLEFLFLTPPTTHYTHTPDYRDFIYLICPLCIPRAKPNYTWHIVDG